ncbi:hypothetical protein V1291_005218 [Nitrobacteraceae bacterium AZCC 1564]
MIADLISLIVAGFRLWHGSCRTSRAWEAGPQVLRRLKLFGARHRT